MCCVGTKFLLADYNYVLDRFIELDAVSEENAVSMKELDFDFGEHMFARDNLQSLIRCKDIVKVEGKLYLQNDRRRDIVCGKKRLFGRVV